MNRNYFKIIALILVLVVGVNLGSSSSNFSHDDMVSTHTEEFEENIENQEIVDSSHTLVIEENLLNKFSKQLENVIFFIINNVLDLIINIFSQLFN